MKTLILAAAVLLSGAAQAHDRGGPHRHGGRGDGRGDYRRDFPRGGRAHGWNRWEQHRHTWRPRVYVTPPRYRVWPQPFVVSPPIGAVVRALPPGASLQVINGLTYAVAGPTWFLWDGFRGAWVVVGGP